MLVLNRRPGESIVIEHGIQLTVISVVERQVWLELIAAGLDGALQFSATVLSDDHIRLAVGLSGEVRITDDGVWVQQAPAGSLAAASRAVLSVDRAVDDAVLVGDQVRITVRSASGGFPSLGLDGTAIGFDLGVSLLRVMGSYVRIGIDAPAERRVYRKELWDEMVTTNGGVPDPAGTTDLS